jgi:glutamine amidotransferase
MITIIDYGMGNLGSIANMIKRIGYSSDITDNLGKIRNADKIILPGVGNFDKAMKNLADLKLIEVLKEKTLNNKTPILGICLGMQLMTNKSEESNEKGLGLIDAKVKRFSFGDNGNFKIPHMGWNLIQIKKENPLIHNLPEEPRFYFVHSYHVSCNNQNDILTTTHYGYDFDSAFAVDNIMGVQFHPEKSHKFGMQLLKNFIENF